MAVDDLVGVGLDLRPDTLISAYRAGLFPMRLHGRRGPLGWWSPDPRGILPLERLHVSRSLRRSMRGFRVTVDRAFADVLAGCADRSRPDGWISSDLAAAYTRLFELGSAHSVEVWTPEGRLAGGLYGVSIGGFFAGESMFHRVTDASKVAVASAVGILTADGVEGRLFDVQWTTPHLQSLGAVDVGREAYLRLLAAAVRLPSPAAFS